LRVALVVSEYHSEITSALEAGARRTFAAAGGSARNLLRLSSPGAFELPVITAAALRHGRADAIVALGCIVRGETPHDGHLASSVARELGRLAVDHGRPVAFGVLTVHDLAQARARAGGAEGNKGEEAMSAALAAAATIRTLSKRRTARKVRS